MKVYLLFFFGRERIMGKGRRGKKGRRGNNEVEGGKW